MENLNKRGGKGMFTLGCLPLLGREGVTLPAAAENYSNDGEKRVSSENRNNQI
jgi:hypothetical protein